MLSGNSKHWLACSLRLLLLLLLLIGHLVIISAQFVCLLVEWLASWQLSGEKKLARQLKCTTRLLRLPWLLLLLLLLIWIRKWRAYNKCHFVSSLPFLIPSCLVVAKTSTVYSLHSFTSFACGAAKEKLFSLRAHCLHGQK